MTFSEYYAFCIGEVGISKDEYWRLTPAETAAKVTGFLINRDIEASNFRALFWLNFNQWSKQPKAPESLWPLSIDKKNGMTAEQMYERNKRIIEHYKKQQQQQNKK